LEKLKKLSGTWVATDKDGKPTSEVVSVFRVTSAGSAVHETIFPGTDHEMVSVYHLDGKDLVMTHYCALGNQPRMKLDAKSQPNQLVFHSRAGPTSTRPRTCTCTKVTSPSSTPITLNGRGRPTRTASSRT